MRTVSCRQCRSAIPFHSHALSMHCSVHAVPIASRRIRSLCVLSSDWSHCLYLRASQSVHPTVERAQSNTRAIPGPLNPLCRHSSACELCLRASVHARA